MLFRLLYTQTCHHLGQSHSVIAALSWCFAILVNKFCKIIKIFEQIKTSESSANPNSNS
jgi:hypothetical protein